MTVEDNPRQFEGGENVRSRVISLALKDEGTYLITVDAGGLNFIKNHQLAFSGELPGGNEVEGLIYVEHLDSFVFLQSSRLYQKKMDENPPYLFMDLKSFDDELCPLDYSRINRRLFTLSDSDKITVINIVEKRVEFKFDEFSIFEFQVFGERENKILSISRGGCLSLLTFNFELKKLIHFSQSKIELIGERFEEILSFAVSGRNDHVLVELAASGMLPKCSRMMIFEIMNNRLILRATLDPFEEGLKGKFALSCFGHFGNSILWVGLEAEEYVQVYEYNLDTKVLRELDEKRVNHQARLPLVMKKVDNCYFYASSGGLVKRLTVSF